MSAKHLVPTVKENAHWAPLESLVAVDEFERVGTRREVQNWREYTGLLTQWAGAIERFETTVLRVPNCRGSGTSRPKSATSATRKSPS